MRRVGGRPGRTPHGDRRRRIRLGLGLVVVAVLAATGVSVHERRVLDDRNEQAGRDVADARRAEEALDLKAADLEARIDELAVQGQGHLDTAAHIEEVVADITTARAEIERLAAALGTARADRAARQDRIDLLLGCRDTLVAATEQLTGAPAPSVGASATLDAGRAQCQVALAMVQGDTGATHPYDFPDPSILLVGDTYYAYGTEGPGGPIQTMSSKDLRSWTVLPTALANLPAWARPGTTWAPSAHPIGGRFVLYYAARSKISGNLCISSAAGLTPAGPFLDDSTVPLVCQDGLGGSIDPNVHVDELGFAHLTWKSEDETEGGSAHLWSQYLGADGRSVLGAPGVLLRSDQAWEDDTIENPSMAHIDGTWILLYSGNRWNTPDYSIGYAVCETANGPCRRPQTSRVLGSTATYQGPGGAHALRTRGGRMVVAFAAWDRGNIGYPNPRRLHLATVTYRNGTLALADL